MREGRLPQGWAHAVRDFMARDLGWVDQRLVGEDFYIFFSSPTTQVCLIVRFISLFTCPLGAGGAHGLGSLFWMTHLGV